MNEADNEETQDFEEEGFSLEELSQSYASVVSNSRSEEDAESETAEPGSNAEVTEVAIAEEDQAEDHFSVTPLSIVEAALFVGRPDNTPIPAKEIAQLIRGVSSADVEHLIEELRQIYADTERALEIQESPAGYQLALAQDLNALRDRFYGKVREVKLNQAAVDCLALVAYQPGISRSKLDEQRGQNSSGVLNQLVRRQLIEMRREPGANEKPEPHYFPTDKLLDLAGLECWDDLPQVEDFE